MNSPSVAFAATYGRSVGSSRVRMFNWLAHLGLQARLLTFFPSEVTRIPRTPAQLLSRTVAHRRHLFELAESSDVMFIQREASPFSRGWLEIEAFRRAGRGVLDLDDGLQWDHGLGLRLRSLVPKSSKTARLAAAAHTVIAGNEALAEWAARLCDHVVLIPSCIDPSAYSKKQTYALSTPPTIGWIGSWSGEKYVSMLSDVLLEVHAKYGARLNIIGDSRSRLASLEHIVDRIPWSPQAEGALMAGWDLALMPLADGLFERGKCAYKLLQYGAVGVPAIFSPLGANAQFPRSGSLSKEHIVSLLEGTPEARAASAAALHRDVLARFAYEAWTHEWVRAVLEREPQA